MRGSILRGMTGAAFIALASGGAAGDTFNDLAAFQAATTDLTYLNFDVDQNGVPFLATAEIGNGYAALGVQFPPGNYVSFAAQPVSQPFAWFNDTDPGDDTRVFDADFTRTDITAVGVHQALFAEGQSTTLVAFDAGGNEIGSVLSDNDGNTLDFFGLTTTTPIARVVITYVNPGGWALDDMYFGRALGGCNADFNGDNQVDFFDYLDFVQAFDAEDPSADFNGDNQVDFFDYLDFAIAFDDCQ
jgi:hypothetical protein